MVPRWITLTVTLAGALTVTTVRSPELRVEQSRTSPAALMRSNGAHRTCALARGRSIANVFAPSRSKVGSTDVAAMGRTLTTKVVDERTPPRSTYVTSISWRPVTPGFGVKVTVSSRTVTVPPEGGVTSMISAAGSIVIAMGSRGSMTTASGCSGSIVTAVGVLVGVGVGVGEALAEGEALTVGDGEGDPDPDTLAEALADADGDAVAEVLGVTDGDGLDEEAEAEAEVVGEADGDPVGDGDVDAEADADAEAVGLASARR